MKRQFQAFNFTIRNAANDSVDIYIDGQIVDAETQEIWAEWFGDNTSVSFKSFRTQLLANDVKTYNVYINSPGGIVTDAMAIHDLLVEIQGKGKTVNTVGRGIVASAATYILMAGKRSSMSKNSWFMIHNASGFAWGDVNQVEREAATLRKINNAVRDFYAETTGLSKDEIAEMMNAETWLTADEAKEKGFVKQVAGESSFTNALQKEHWQFSNMAVFNAYNAAVKPTQPVQPDNNSFIQNQFEDMKKFFQNIVDAIKGTKPAENSATITGEQIALAVQKPFEDAATEIENTINTGISNALKGEAFTNAVNSAVTNALKPLSDKVTNLEKENGEIKKKNDDLEKDIANKIGAGSNTNKDEGSAPKVIGSFGG